MNIIGILNSMASAHLLSREGKEYIPMKIDYCDGHMCIPFSEASINFADFNNRSSAVKRVTYVDWSSIIEMTKDHVRLVRRNGELELHRHSDTSDNRYEDQKRALNSLLSFIQEMKSHEEALVKVLDQKGGEAEACAVLAAHIFAKLSPGEVVVEKGIQIPSKTCSCGCKAPLTLGNTGIGSKYLWHGFPDILVKHTAVSVLPVEEPEMVNGGEEDEITDDPVYCVDDKSLYDYSFSKRTTAQAIVNGYAQQAHSRNYKGLVPSVACTLTNVIIFLYDPERDILLRRKQQMPLLYKQRELKLPTIVELWFFLNIHLFGTELNDTLCSRLQKSSVKDMFETRNVLQLYKNSAVGVDRNELVNISDDLNPSSLSVILEAGISNVDIIFTEEI